MKAPAGAKVLFADELAKDAEELKVAGETLSQLKRSMLSKLDEEEEIRRLRASSSLAPLVLLIEDALGEAKAGARATAMLDHLLTKKSEMDDSYAQTQKQLSKLKLPNPGEGDDESRFNQNLDRLFGGNLSSSNTLQSFAKEVKSGLVQTDLRQLNQSYGTESEKYAKQLQHLLMQRRQLEQRVEEAFASCQQVSAMGNSEKGGRGNFWGAELSYRQALVVSASLERRFATSVPTLLEKLQKLQAWRVAVSRAVLEAYVEEQCRVLGACSQAMGQAASIPEPLDFEEAKQGSEGVDGGGSTSSGSTSGDNTVDLVTTIARASMNKHEVAKLQAHLQSGLVVHKGVLDFQDGLGGTMGQSLGSMGMGSFGGMLGAKQQWKQIYCVLTLDSFLQGLDCEDAEAVGAAVECW
jgi:hypothetical protein